MRLKWFTLLASFFALVMLILDQESKLLYVDTNYSTRTDLHRRNGSPSSSTQSTLPPKGVFVLKVTKVQQAYRTICSLTSFSNAGYPIQIFSEQNYTADQLAELQSYADKSSVAIVVDSEGWKHLPPSLTVFERDQVLLKCTDMETPVKAKCSALANTPLSYVYMGYWRYMLMAYEPTLQGFDYFVSIDVDAILTQPMPDPFVIMADNNLTGIFNVDQFQGSPYHTGIQQAAEAVFSLEERRNRYLDTPQNGFFDNEGKWLNQEAMHASIWGYFFGGRLDFFRSSRFVEFARRMVPYTYTYRTDEQAVIAVAWSLLAGSKVWHLSQRNISMGIFHQGWVDHQQVVRRKDMQPFPYIQDDKNHSLYWLNPIFDGWRKFKGAKHEHRLLAEEYVGTLGYKASHSWERCICAKSKVNFVLRKACPNYTAFK